MPNVDLARFLESAAGPIETQAGGLFLLLRAVLDARLPECASALAFPAKGDAGIGACLATLALRWAGLGLGVDDEELDAGVRLFAGREAPTTVAALRAAWEDVDGGCCGAFQTSILETLDRLRLVDRSRLHLYELCSADGVETLFMADGSGRLWLRACRVADGLTGPAVSRWLEHWAELTGAEAPALFIDTTVERMVAQRVLSRSSQVRSVDPRADANEVEDSGLAAHREGRARLVATLDSLSSGAIGVPDLDLTVALTAGALLRLWARWLRQFSGSGVPYLLERMIRRPGTLFIDEGELTVELSPEPLDVVLEMAGYMDDLDLAPWTAFTRVRIRS